MAEREFAEKRYEQMQHRRCGRSGLILPQVSLGFWKNLGEPGNEALARDCCYYAFDNGVFHFDLANNYGPPPGNSERVVGQILRDMPREELIISSKAGYRHWRGPHGSGGSKKYLVASLDASLRRLGLDYVDIFYHHCPDPDTPLEETLGALDLIVRQGKALYVGVSNYKGERFGQAVQMIDQRGWAPITIHQPYYNMLGREIEADLLPRTEAAGTGVIAFCPLAQGVLTDKYLHGLPAASRQGRRGERGRKWYEQRKAQGVWDKVASLHELAAQRGQTLAQMALSWILRDQRVTSVVIGVSSLDQLSENIASIHAGPLSDEELDRIETILAG